MIVLEESKKCCKTCLHLMEDYMSGQWVCLRCSEAYNELIIPHNLDDKCLNYCEGGDLCEYYD